MKTLSTILFLCCLSPITQAQSNGLSFDGVSSYVDLGVNAGNAVRTFEMWFKLDAPVDSTLSEYLTLTAREVSGVNNDEFAIHLIHTGLPNPGCLRLFMTESVNLNYSVYSDNNTWNANQWYHVAAVIHPVDGMMLFIDGIKQSSTNSYTSSTTTATEITTLGCQGNLFNRFFKGVIDDVRFSNEAIYSSNFTPPCPDLSSTNATIGLWNLNEGFGISTTDNSGNSNTGTIYGATWTTTNVCSLGINEIDHSERTLIKIVDFMGREVTFKTGTPLIFIYSDGSLERVFEFE